MFGLFKSRPKGPIESPFEVDIHSHLIPGIDDGSQSMDESVDMLRQFSEWGYRKVVTTPHIMLDYYKNDPTIINEGLAALRERLEQEDFDIEVEAAAEYYLDEHFEKLIEADNLLTFGDRYLLFELPFFSKPANYEQIVFALLSKGYKPVLAHPERYTYFHDKKLEQFQTIRDQGALLQINLMSLVGAYSEDVMRTAWKMIEAGLVDFVGSDLHRERQLKLLEKVFRHRNFDLLRDQNLLNSKL